MNWLVSLRDQLPPLLVLSPLIGFLVTLVAVRADRELVRHLALSNSFCTLLLLLGSVWAFESDLVAEATARRPTADDVTECGSLEGAQAMVHRRVDKERAGRLESHLFIVDGINLWPTIVLSLLTGIVVWQSGRLVGSSIEFVPTALLFQSASMGALTANNVQVYSLSYGLAVLAMCVMLGRWGGLERRVIAERFLTTQISGYLLVMLGFAMLVVAIPWMKIEDSPTRPSITSNLSTIIYEIQKWTTANGLAFHYASEMFPWMLVVLSMGFAIQFGLFPFQSSQIAIISHAPSGIAALYLAGLLSASSIGWLRFVLPLAPDLMVGICWLMLVPSLAGAIWAALRSLTPGEPRRQAAFIFSSLSAVSLMGCYTFSRFGTSGTWLMQQQLTVFYCLVMLGIEFPQSEASIGPSPTRPLRSGYSTRTVLLTFGMLCLGLFASGFIVVSELFRDYLSQIPQEESGESVVGILYDFCRDSLMLIVAILVSVFLIWTTIYSLLIRHVSDHANKNLFRGSPAIFVLLFVVVNLFPSLMLHQCEPEFARVFRRFERTVPATSADPELNERQTSP